MKLYYDERTAKNLVKKMEKGEINFDTAYQRNLVWDEEKKSLLIHTMLYGYAIPALYFVKGEDNKTFDSLDGKQRSNAISGFRKNEFALVKIPPVYDDDGEEVDVSGKTFDELPEWAQDRIDDYSLKICYYDDITEAEIREFFFRINNGKTLTAAELTRVKAPCLERFQELAKMDAVQLVMTDAARKRFIDENLTMQIYNLLTVEKDNDFSTKVFRTWVQGLTVLDEEKLSIIKDALTVFSGVYRELQVESVKDKEKKKLCTTLKRRIHFVSAVYATALMLERYEIGEFFASKETAAKCFLEEFFAGNPSRYPAYNQTVGSGSAKPGAVQMRKSVIKDAVKKFCSGQVKSLETSWKNCVAEIKAEELETDAAVNKEPVNKEPATTDDTTEKTADNSAEKMEGQADLLEGTDEKNPNEALDAKEVQALAAKVARLIRDDVSDEGFKTFEEKTVHYEMTERDIREYVCNAVKECGYDYLFRDDTAAISMNQNEMSYGTFERVLLEDIDILEQEIAEELNEKFIDFADNVVKFIKADIGLKAFEELDIGKEKQDYTISCVEKCGGGYYIRRGEDELVFLGSNANTTDKMLYDEFAEILQDRLENQPEAEQIPDVAPEHEETNAESADEQTTNADTEDDDLEPAVYSDDDEDEGDLPV